MPHIRETIDALTKCIRITNGIEDRWLAFDDAATILEADRAAAKLEVLAEIETLAYRKSHAEAAPTFEVHTADAFREIRAKYVAQAGGGG